MRIFALVMGWLLAVALAPMAAAQEKAWVQIEALPSLAEAEQRAQAYAAAFPNVVGYRGKGNWHIVAMGPFLPEEAAGKLAELRRENLIPDDAFISDGQGYGEAFFPAEGATAPEPAPEAAAEAAAEPQPETIDPAALETPVVEEPDETPKQAKASEAELSKDERKELQAALKWYGFYDNTIDGAFGAGTRKSMAAWQEANGFEPTGVLTTRQRATMTANHAADLAEFGFETITEPEAGIEITLPMSLVQFSHYEPPFANFAEKNGSGLQVLLISEPGGTEALSGLYDILQTLEVVPQGGERQKGENSFTINAASDSVQSLAYAETRDGMVKGYLVVWKPADADRMERILPALRTSFRGVGDKALDPGLVPMEDSVRSGLLAGLEIKKPTLSRSGFYVDVAGHVVTTAEAVQSCARVTLDHDIEAEVTEAGAATGIAVLTPKAPLAPQSFAALASASPKVGSEVAIAGFSYEDRLTAPVLTFGSFEEAKGLNGETGVIRLTAPVLAGDAGGPVLDTTGAVLGMLSPAAKGDKVLPEGVAMAVDAAAVSAALTAAGLQPTSPVGTAPLSPDALNAAALGMTVLVSCWAE